MSNEPSHEKLIDLNRPPANHAHVDAIQALPDEPPLHDVTGSGSFSDTGVHMKPSGLGFDEDFQLPVHPDNLRYNRNDWMRHPVTTIIASIISIAASARIALWTFPTISVAIARGDYPGVMFSAIFPLVPLWLYWRFLRSSAAPWYDDDSYVGQGQYPSHFGPFL